MEGGDMAGAIADVAALAGVSKATASRALSGKGYVSPETRQRVVQAASTIGYVASPNAASLVTGHTKNVGVVIPYIGRWFFGQILEGIEQQLLARGYDMTLYTLEPFSPARDRVFDFFLARKRFDGVIAVNIQPAGDELERLHRLGIPLVGIGGPLEGIPTIAIDDERVAALATEHLIRLGHQRIAHIGGSLAEQLDFSVHGERLAGYRAALADAGLAEADQFVPTQLSVPGGYDAAVQLLSNPANRPTAIFAASDEVAIGTIIAARRMGIAVPTDLSVIGIDGHDYAELFSLTTVEQHPREQGVIAADMILAGIDGGSAEPGVRDLPTRLVMRSSTGRPAGV
jgi:LacI family repressor for deo operon, udp, cdd, tsx, nupC, and nupG